MKLALRHILRPCGLQNITCCLQVWALRCDVHVLDHGGNLTDACILAALAAFMVHRRCEVTVGGESGTEVGVCRLQSCLISIPHMDNTSHGFSN